jgi:hypothetical protein
MSNKFSPIISRVFLSESLLSNVTVSIEKLNGLLKISRDFSKQKSELFLSKIGILKSRGSLVLSISFNDRNRYKIIYPRK